MPRQSQPAKTIHVARFRNGRGSKARILRRRPVYTARQNTNIFRRAIKEPASRTEVPLLLLGISQVRQKGSVYRRSVINIERQPNTIYVLSLSYGKDSIATLEACKQLGYPVDAVVHSEVWFNDEISADLPPMLEFKKYADKVIKERYGLDVTHICAMKKPVAGGGVPSEEHTKIHFTNTSPAQEQQQESNTTENKDVNTSMGSPTEKELGATADSKPQPSQKLTYCDLFYTRYKHSKNPRFGGGLYGFPTHIHPKCQDRLKGTILDKYYRVLANLGLPNTGGQWCTSRLKTSAISNLGIPNQKGKLVYRPQNPIYTDSPCSPNQPHGESESKSTPSSLFSDKPTSTTGGKVNIVQYLGIAADELERIERHIKKKGIVLPLVDIGWDEAYCRKWCEENNLLSPIYTTATRGGCWFCHNQGVGQLRLLRKNYPELWAHLLRLDLDSPTTFHADGHTVHDFEKRFQAEDDGLIPDGKPFRWKMLEKEEEKNTVPDEVQKE